MPPCNHPVRPAGRVSAPLACRPRPLPARRPRLPPPDAYASLARANDALPLAVLAATGVGLACPSAVAFFTPAWYGPGLGFLSFAIGVSLRPAAFKPVLTERAGAALLGLGALLQWGVKPALAVAIVRALPLPAGVATGLLLVACVSGAQLANYATFLAAPAAAPLSVVLTAAGTAAGAVLTPALTLALVGARAPVDPAAVFVSIAQVVAAPIGLGLLLAVRAPRVVEAARPGLAAAALVDTCLCVAASLASNAASLGAAGAAVAPVLAFHAAAAAAGGALAAGAGAPVAGRRCFSLQGGMQSSLLSLLLASRLFAADPAVAATAGVSTVTMTLGGFGAAAAWRARDGVGKGAAA
jgi:BASS family bile acid:Na+ symporter